MPSFIIVEYNWQILDPPPPHRPWAAPKKPILDRVNLIPKIQIFTQILLLKINKLNYNSYATCWYKIVTWLSSTTTENGKNKFPRTSNKQNTSYCHVKVGTKAWRQVRRESTKARKTCEARRHVRHDDTKDGKALNIANLELNDSSLLSPQIS